MYASIGGLKAHMQKLSVIGNNVANVNTQGYKHQRTVFRDSVYSMYRSGSDGTQVVGGKNPSQLGYGSMVGSIDLNMSSSNYNPGNPMDCALVGDGFFLVGTKDNQYGVNPDDYSTFTSENLKSLNLTRVGDFEFKADGYLCDGNGNPVYGFLVTGMEDGKPVVSDQLVPIRKPRWEKVPTTKIEEDDDGNEIAVPDYKYEIRYPTDIVEEGEGDDAKAVVGPLTDTVKPQDKSNRVDASTGEATEDESKMKDLDLAEFSSISIDKGSGAITGYSREGNEPVIIGYLAIGSVSNPNGVTHVGDSYYQCQEGAGDLRVCMLGGKQKELGITNVNSYMCQALNEDGTPAEDGNPVYPAGTAILGTGGTKMMTGFLEGPNVDLAEEISALITTQRGYQANTRIITVTDSMLEELVNMKR